jgi:putative hydrolase of the HAD superfamily
MEPLRQTLATWPFTPLAPLPTAAAPCGSLRRPVSALLLDVYGTLLVSAAGDIATTGTASAPDGPCRQQAEASGVDLFAPELRDRLHRRIAAVHRELRSKGVDVPEVRIERIWMDLLGTNGVGRARRVALIYELCVNPVWPMPAADELLAACRRRKIILGLVSNAQFFTGPVIERLFGKSMDDLGFSPDLRIFSYRLQRAKPSPVLFEAACDGLRAMGIAPEAALYVGNDMLNDVWAARRAGLQTALFAGDARSLRLRTEDPRCADLTPDLVVTELCRLADLLVRMPPA